MLRFGEELVLACTHSHKHTHTHARTHRHTHKSVCTYEDVTALRNQAVHTDRKVTTDVLNVIITKNKKEKNLHSDRCGNTSGQEYHTTGSRRGISTRVYLEK